MSQVGGQWDGEEGEEDEIFRMELPRDPHGGWG